MASADATIDAERKILEWCGHLAVPKWVDEKLVNNCKACKKTLKTFLKDDGHHCRLCGQLYCGACTQKYHVPLIFRIKNKDGPARVCMSCVDGCMAEKKAAEAPKANPHDLSVSKITASSLASSSVNANVASMGKVEEVAPPDYWQEEKEFVACPKCRASKCASYNCRVCGSRYCDKCTSKMDVPASFERKAKSGPSRVCDPCRFRVVSGTIKLVDKLSGAQGAAKALFGQQTLTGAAAGIKGPPQPPASRFGSTLGAPAGAAGAAGGHGRRLSAVAKTCSAVGCAAIAVGAEGKCLAHGGSAAGAGAAPKDVRLAVKRESDGSVLAELVLPTLDTPLSTIDVLMKKTAPQAEAYSFVFRGAPIPEAFHGVFHARHLGAVVFIRAKQLSALALAAEQAGVDAIGAAADDGVAGGGADGGVAATNNPFKRDVAKEAELAAKRATTAGKKPPKKEVAVVEFKRVSPKVTQQAKHKVAAAAQRAAGSSAGGGVVKAPPPLPGAGGKPGPPPIPGAGGAAAAAAAGGKIDDILKARAKAHFGAL